MAQLHCYIPDNVASLFKQKAREAGLSTSKYLALLVNKETSAQWPDNYFDLAGSWLGAPLTRPDQPNIEEREELK